MKVKDVMDEPHLKLTDKAAPIVFTYRRVLRRPQIEVEQRFVGLYQFVKNVVSKVGELLDELAFEEKRNVVDPGESQAVHWALQVRDPFESTGTAEVVAFQTTGYRPPAGFHFEVISVVEHELDTDDTNGTGTRRPPNAGQQRVRESLQRPQEEDQ
jgi:hypothetical protein